MALTVNHPVARKLYGMELQRVVPYRSFFYQNKFVVPEANSETPDADLGIIVEMNDLAEPSKSGGKASGYEVRYDLDGPLTGYTTPGDQNITQKASQLALFYDLIQINQERKSTKDFGEFAESLVPHEFRERATRAFGSYWPIWTDERVIIKACGAIGDGTWLTVDPAASTTSARDVEGSVASDGNDLRAPSTNRIVYGDGQATQAGITIMDKMTYNVIDRALLTFLSPASNSTLNRTITPIMVAGRPAVVLVMDYTQAFQLAQDPDGRHYDINKAKLQGGYKDSALVQGSLGVYQSPIGVDVILYSHPKMVKFSAATTGGVKVARAVMMGQSALRIARGRNSKKLAKYKWHEESDNRGNMTVITTGNVVGIQKCAYNTTETGGTREDWGTGVIDTYSNWVA
jgi:N4-gp56 family major capsid protein